ncbi:MAG: glutamine--fructose-6-phosphate transaminase (isomerizing) [Candidatus Dadabacteria bacterium]|nr:MAG: glutamine--fructose-6-phosphate transaminase (isomerizing) [Candidatus Dadabacteria bacterium]
MCGIVGYSGKGEALDFLLSGLERLEYRGYDSSGIAIISEGEFRVVRAVGKISNLKKAVKEAQLPNSSIGIGHTRWATHGKPSLENAHPHTVGRVSLIHNGIIENYLTLRRKLEAQGCKFLSETDTEVIAQLLNWYLTGEKDQLEALQKTCSELEGSYAFVALDKENPTTLLLAKSATPLVVGRKEGEVFVASDIPALLNEVRKITVLEDGDIAIASPEKFLVINQGKEQNRKPTYISWDIVTAQKGGYKHYLLKEIHEQPQAVTDSLSGRMLVSEEKINFKEINQDFLKRLIEARSIILVGCGTAWHAGLVAKNYFEGISKISTVVEYASEFRYKKSFFSKSFLNGPLEGAVLGAISQSGETADTLGAVDIVKERVPTFAVCNVLGSSLTRAVNETFYTHAGPEISVASTKAFTTQVLISLLIALYIYQEKHLAKANSLEQEMFKKVFREILHLPALVKEVFTVEDEIKEASSYFRKVNSCLYLGRGICFPIAVEGALKLKEISYIHAEGYPAGEMKHGPIALIEEETPVVFLLQDNSLMAKKIFSAMAEVKSRGAKNILITNYNQLDQFFKVADTIIKVPTVSEVLSPFVLTVPLQLLAYYVAVMRGTDVDLPRNLAKSVTVE